MLDTLRSWLRGSELLRASLGLAVVIALLLPQALRGWSPGTGDIQAMFLGQGAALANCLAHGSWPLWDPLLGFGQPMLANPGNQVVYPPSWLNLLFLPETCALLYVAGHLLWAGLGTVLLARRGIGLSLCAAWMAGAAWMASGPLLSHVQRWQHFASAAWLPWLVFAAGRCAAEPTLARVVTLSVVLALQWLSGSVELALASLIIALVWSTHASAQHAGILSRWLRTWIPGLAVAVTLTAVQWLPAMDLLRNSARAEVASSGRLSWSIHPWRAVELLAPLRLDEWPLRPEVSARLFGASGSTIAPSLYVGATVSGLVLLGLLTPGRRRLKAGLLTLALVAAALSLGSNLGAASRLLDVLPGISILRFPGKLTILFSFAWALLAGLGLDDWQAHLENGARASRRAYFVFGLSAFPAALIAILGGFLPGVLAAAILVPPPPGARVWDAVWIEMITCSVAVAACAGAALLTLLAQRRPSWRLLAVAALSCLTTVDLLAPNHRLNGLNPSELSGRTPETAHFLRSVGASRIHVFESYPGVRAPGDLQADSRWNLDPRNSLPPLEAAALGMNLALAGRSSTRWGLAGSFGLEASIAPTRQQFVLNRTLVRLSGQPSIVRLLQSGGVSHVVARQLSVPGLSPLRVVPSPLLHPIVIHTVPDPLPRTFLVGTALVGSDDTAIGALLDRSFDTRGSVVINEGPALSADPVTHGTSRVSHDAPDRIGLEVEASRPAYVVLLDMFDPGWKATLDGRSIPVRRANFGFRAVLVPAGRHVVEMTYRPTAVIVGAFVSALTLCGLLLFGARAWQLRHQLLRQ